MDKNSTFNETLRYLALLAEISLKSTTQKMRDRAYALLSTTEVFTTTQG